MKRFSCNTLIGLTLALSVSCKTERPKTAKESSPYGDYQGEEIADADQEAVVQGSGDVDPQNCIFIAMKAPIQTIDPRQARTPADSNLCQLIFDGLDNLIQDVNVLPDQKTYSLTLRHSTWSNGDPVTAHDFVYSIQSSLDPMVKAPSAYHLFIIENAKAAFDGTMPINSVGVEALDDNTLLIKLEQPTPHFLKFTNTEAFLPLPKKWLTEHSQVTTEMPTNGPFVLKSFSPEKIVLQKNLSYWDKNQIRLSQITLLYLDADAQTKQYEKGALDYIGAPFSHPIMKDKSTQDRVALAGQFLRVNTHSPLFSNQKIRQAFAQAVNRNRLVSRLADGSKATNTLVPTELQIGEIVNSKADAKQLFDEALLEMQLVKETMEKPVLTFQDNPRNRTLAESLVQDWKISFGIDVALDPISDKALFYNKLFKGKYELILGTWMADIDDPLVFLQPFQCACNGSNATGWENSDFITLLNESSKTADPIRRLGLLRQAEEILLDEAAVIPLLQYSYTFQTSDRLKNVELTSLGLLDLRDAFIAKAK